METAWAQASEIAAAVREGRASASDVVTAALVRIGQRNPALNAFTAVLGERAVAKAAAIDKAPANARAALPLAGVPFAVKNLFDIAGMSTRAGSKINRERVPATRDATLISRLETAGAVLVGALNMGEYAYDFTGENVHDGACRNPHDVRRMSGGSSSGSGAAVAGSLFCGIFGLKPTYGRLSRARSFPFVASLDHVGPMARSTGDLALAYDAMQGHDPDDPVCADRPIEAVTPLIDRGIAGLGIAVAGGYFRIGAYPQAQTALARVAAVLGAEAEIELPEPERARSAAYVITASEGAALHLDRLRTRPRDFDPAVRDRLIAGAMIPAPLVAKAQKFRRWYRTRVLELFARVDVVLAPVTPCTAPRIGQTTFRFGGIEIPLRANIGVYTQPISFIGLPVVAVPVPLEPLPIGVQIIAAPWREDIALRVARTLEQMGIAAAPRPALGLANRHSAASSSRTTGRAPTARA